MILTSKEPQLLRRLLATVQCWERLVGSLHSEAADETCHLCLILLLVCIPANKHAALFWQPCEVWSMPGFKPQCITWKLTICIKVWSGHFLNRAPFNCNIYDCNYKFCITTLQKKLSEVLQTQSDNTKPWLNTMVFNNPQKRGKDKGAHSMLHSIQKRRYSQMHRNFLLSHTTNPE